MFSDTERPPHPDRVGYWWQRARTLAGIDSRVAPPRPPALVGHRRRSSDGYDLATVAQRLGHSDPSVTLRVYSHALADRDVEVAASLSRLLSEG